MAGILNNNAQFKRVLLQFTLCAGPPKKRKECKSQRNEKLCRNLKYPLIYLLNRNYNGTKSSKCWYCAKSRLCWDDFHKQFKAVQQTSTERIHTDSRRSSRESREENKTEKKKDINSDTNRNTNWFKCGKIAMPLFIEDTNSKHLQTNYSFHTIW